jgi:plasmid stabilization system protein ParE
LLEIEILERARDDIFNIIEYGIEEHGNLATRTYVDKLTARINWFAANPKLGPVHSDLRSGVRSFRQGQHRIYYLASANKLTVARILHLTMDIRHHLE